MWKSGEVGSKCVCYSGYHVHIMQCMQPNFINRSGVPHAHVECVQCMGHTRQKKHPFLIDCKIFSEVRCFHVLTWCCVSRVALLCDKFWACLDMKWSSSGWNCKKVSTVPHLPYLYSLVDRGQLINRNGAI